MKLTMALIALSFSTASAAVIFRRENPPVKMPEWQDPTDPKCGAIEPYSKHKPFEPVVGKTEEAKESQCKACKIRACNAGLPGPDEVGGCRCISYKGADGNYATDCKNLLNKEIPMKYEKCGEARDCAALEGQCVSAKFKMDSAKEAPWMKDDWAGVPPLDDKDQKEEEQDQEGDSAPEAPDWMNPADPKCGAIEPYSKHKPFEPIVGKTEEAKESQCKACKIRACNAGLPAPDKVGGCRCISYKGADGNYATDCKNLLNKDLPMKYEKCGEARDCDALRGQCVSAKFKMDSAKEAPWQKEEWEGAESQFEGSDAELSHQEEQEEQTDDEE